MCDKMKRLIHIGAEHFGVPDEAIINPQYKQRSGLWARYAVAVILADEDVSTREISSLLGYSDDNGAWSVVAKARNLQNTNKNFDHIVERIRSSWIKSN
jgi:hypothetical protein